MKFLHTSDLHIGKRLNDCSFLEDQKYILDQILMLMRQYQPDGLILAGDLYDKSIPSGEAVTLLDDFLTKAAALCPVFAISGNHDSAERLAFASRLLEKSGVYLASVYQGKIQSVRLEDEHGPLFLHLLPFIKPASVRPFFPEKEIASYDDALTAVLSDLDLLDGSRHLLVAHQFVTGAQVCESEEQSVGGLDQVSVSHFEAFDYVALGHIHTPQQVKHPFVRYSGTPLKYSFSEAKGQKSITLLELKEKGNCRITLLPLSPLRDLQELEGTFEEFESKDRLPEEQKNDYLHITLTDPVEIPDAAAKLRWQYPNLLKLDQKVWQQAAAHILEGADRPEKSLPELFAELYEKQHEKEMDEEQLALLQNLLQKEGLA